MNDMLEFEEIVGVEEVTDGEIFDLTIDEETPNYFTADGILHHNSGKDFICSLIQAYLVYVILCLRDPQKFFQFAKGESCDIINVARKGQQAERVYFKKFRTRILNWEWLKERYNIIDEGKRFHHNGPGFPTCKVGTKSAEWTDKNVRAFSETSNPEGFEGYNVVFYLADELSAWVTEGGKETAEKMLHVLRTSQSSRKTTKLCGFGAAISYPRMKEDIMFDFEKESLQEGSKTYFSKGYPWEIRPPHLYSGEMFDFNRGSEEEPDIVKVPTELKEDFDKDPTGARAAYLLDPPAINDPFFEFEEKLEAAVTSDRTPLFKLEGSLVPAKDGKGNTIFYIQKRIVGLLRQPDPNVDYVVWIDGAETSCDASLTIAHKEYATVIEGTESRSVECIVVDQTIDFVPIPNERKIVDMTSLTRLCLTMRRYITVAAVWWDQWNSAMGVADLRKAGLLCDRHNLKGADWDFFKQLLYMTRFYVPDTEQGHKGVLQLKHIRRSPTGNVIPGHSNYKKDIADTWCGVATLLLGNLAGKAFRTGSAPAPIHIVSTKKKGAKLASVSPAAQNPFAAAGGMGKQTLVSNHSDLFGGLNHVKGHSKGSAGARVAKTPNGGTSRFPAGIRM